MITVEITSRAWFMAIRFTTQEEHDLVIQASAETYNDYKKQGFGVSINLHQKQCHDIGGGIFPDLVVWWPNGEYGKTIIIEEVETSESVTYQEARQWRKYGDLGFTFYLIVPKDYVSRAQEIIDKENISVNALKYYHIGNNNKIHFSARKRA